jgi:hypothetical protein
MQAKKVSCRKRKKTDITGKKKEWRVTVICTALTYEMKGIK